MSTFPEILDAVRQTASAFDAFRKTHDARHAELLERVEQLEAKGMHPGKTGTRTPPAIDPATTWRTADGTPLPVLRKGVDFAQHYPANTEGLTLADLMRGIARMKTTEAATKALSVGTGSAGGYAVPVVLLPGILEALTPASTVLSAGAGIVDVSQQAAKQYDIAAVDSVPAAAWRAEAGAVSESDPAFRAVSTTPRSLAFMFKASRELLADAPNIEQALRTAIAQAFAKEIDRTALRGSGTPPEPRGILNATSSGVNSVSNGANGASLASTAYANFMSAVQAILEDDCPAPTAAIMSPRSFVVLAGLLDTTNQPRMRPDALRSMQFLATSQIPNNLTVGTSSDCSEIYVGDFTRISIVMREPPTIMLADQLYAATGQVAFVCHVRADIAITYPKAFAVVTGVRP